MSIVASNSYRFNMSMDFWLLKDFTAKDLIDNWNRIINYARDNESDDNTFFLADCMDILYEKVLVLPDKERRTILDKANHDIEIRKTGAA